MKRQKYGYNKEKLTHSVSPVFIFPCPPLSALAMRKINKKGRTVNIWRKEKDNGKEKEDMTGKEGEPTYTLICQLSLFILLPCQLFAPGEKDKEGKKGNIWMKVERVKKGRI